MRDRQKRPRLRSFLLGGVVGSVAGLVAAGRVRVERRPPARRRTPAGLAAFEEAPCFRELLEREGAGAASRALAPERAP